MSTSARLLAALACVAAATSAGRPAWGEAARTVGRFTDGTTVVGSFENWQGPAAQARFAGRPIVGGNPLRWAIVSGSASDATGAEADEPQPFVEFHGGDRLPGVVEARRTGREAFSERLPPHFLVRPLVPVDPAAGPRRTHVRVAVDAVRRIVATPGAAPAKPGTARLGEDGREIAFRGLRWQPDGVLVLTNEGTRLLTFGQIAELRLPDRDPWEAYIDTIAAVAPDVAGRVLRCTTTSGAALTTSLGGLAAAGAAGQPATWEHVVQPAWSLDPLWVRHAEIDSRWLFAPQEVPLPLIDVARVARTAVFGGSWPWRANRNVQGGALVTGTTSAGWGFGVQAGCDLFFPLPPMATAFRAGVALDAAAGSGGCAQARVCLDAATAAPAWQSPVLVGTSDPIDTAAVTLAPRPDGGSLLVLVADQAHEGRPAGADPYDVRDLVDWLDPVIALDAAKLEAEVQKRLPATIPAWKDWAVAVPAGGSLVVREVPFGAARVRRVIARGGPLVLSRTVDVTPDVKFLAVGASRDQETPSAIEIRVDGARVAKADVPRRVANRPVDPFLLPLDRFAGRTVKLEVVHLPADDKGLVEWHLLETSGPLASAWEPLEVVETRTRDGSVLTRLDDGSVLASGQVPKHEVYTVRLRTRQEGITGLRLDPLPHQSLTGASRSKNANFVITNIAATVAPLDAPDQVRPVAFADARSSNDAEDWLRAGHIIDADPRSGWCNQQRDAAAVLACAEPVGFPGGTEFVVTIAMEHVWAHHLLGRFRLSTTTATFPSFELPGVKLADEGAAVPDPPAK